MQFSQKNSMLSPESFYNDQNFLSSVTDPEQRTTTYDTDVMGRVIAIHRPDLSSIGFEYDNNGNMTVLENPSSVAHAFDYNGKGSNRVSP